MKIKTWDLAGSKLRKNWFHWENKQKIII